MVSEKIANLSGVKSHTGSNPVPSSILILIIMLIFIGCCNPEKPVVEINHESPTSLDVKGFDCDCDGDIDYWLHYKDDKKFGSKFYTEGNQGKCEKK